MMTVYSAVFITVCAIKYAYFLYNDFDLAMDVNTAFGLRSGTLYNSVIGVNYLGNHMRLLMIVLAPFYWLAPHPMTLLVIQTLASAAGAYAVYLFARRVLKNGFVAVCFAAVFLLYPSLGYANAYEFHPEVLTTATLLFAFYFLWTKRLGWMIVFAVLSLLGKENVPLVIIMMGLYAFLLKRRRRWVYAVTLIGLGAVHLFVSFGLVMPAANRGEVGLESIYSEWGPSTGQAVVAMAKDPVRVVRTLFTTPDNPQDTQLKQFYYLQVLLPVMLLSLLSPLTLAIALPSIAQHLLSSRMSDHTIVYHYMIQITPIVMLSAVLGLRNVLRWMMRGIPGGLTEEVMNTRTPPRTLGYILSVFAVLFAVMSNVLFGPLTGLGILQPRPASQANLPSAYDRAVVPYMAEMVSRVPEDAGVAAGFRCLQRLAYRRNIHSLHHIFKGSYTLSDKPYPIPEDIDAVVVDTSNWMYCSFFRVDGGKRLRKFFDRNRLVPVMSAGDAVLLLRDAKESIKLYETGRFVPQQPYRATYNGQLTLRGWDGLPVSVARGERMPLRTYWQSVVPADRTYFTELLLYDVYQRPVYRHVRHLGYTFYPAHDWPRGLDVQETYQFVVPLNLRPGVHYLCLRVLEGWGQPRQVSRPDEPGLARRAGIIRLGTIEVR